jgi:hypothetical protein
MRTDGQKDRQNDAFDETNRRFCDYANEPKIFVSFRFFMLHLKEVFLLACTSKGKNKDINIVLFCSHGNIFIQIISCPMIRHT